MDKALIGTDFRGAVNHDHGNTLLSITKIKITLVFFHKTMRFFEKDIFRSLIPFLLHRDATGISCRRMLIFPPRRRKYFFFLRSPHVDKKSIESYYFINSKILFNIFLNFPKMERCVDAKNLIVIFHKLLLLNLLSILQRRNLFLQLKIVYYGIYSF